MLGEVKILLNNIIQSKPETVSTEYQNTFETLFFIALDDLDSSVILYHRGHYPQSVFYLQQAVEKAVKSMGLLFGLVNEEDLQGKIGHKPLEVYRKPANKFSEEVIVLNNKLEDYPEFKGMMDLSGVNFDEFVASMKKGKHELNKYIKTIVDYNLTKEELEDYINKIEDLNTELAKLNKKINEEGISDEKFAEIKTEVKTKFESTIDSLKIPNKLKEQMQEELRLLFSSFFPNKDIFESIIWYTFNILGIGMNLFFLSIITSLHSSKARYPEDNFNPLTFYTPDLPLVERLPEIQNITRQTLEKMDEIYDLMINPPDNLIDLSENLNLKTGENPDEQ